MADDLDTILDTNTKREGQAQTSGFGSARTTAYGTASSISLLPNEQVLLESGGKTLILTTHRVRYDSQRMGGGEIISIMLDELASCAMIRRSKPVLLIFAGMLLLISLYFYNQYQQSLGTFGFLLVAVLIVMYFVTRRQVIELDSAGASIRVNTSGMSVLAVRGFIDTAEEAKNGRYLSGSTNTV